MVQNYHIHATFKTLLALLELPLPSLHDEEIAGVTKAWTGMAHQDGKSAAWPGRLSGPDHGLRHGGDAIVVADMVGVGVLHQPGLSGQGHPLGLFHSAVMGRSAALSRSAGFFLQ